MVFEIITLHFHKIWTIYNTFAVPEAHKYEQNKAGTTNTDYEHINKKKKELPSESRKV